MKWSESEFFEQSVPVLTRAIYGIQHFLPPKQWNRLHTVLLEYQSHHKSEFAGGRTRVIAAIKADLGTGKTHGQTLREFLDRFDKCLRERA